MARHRQDDAWESGVEEARRDGSRVLSARPSDAEARLAFGGLIDVLDPVRTEELTTLAAPQLEALEVALLRRHRPATPHRRAPWRSRS